MIIFVKKIIKYLFNFLYCLFKIRNLKSCYDLVKVVEFAFSGCGGLIRPAQIRPEIENLLMILEKFKPKNILEIGTAGGGTLFLFSRIASKKAHIISIDLPVKGILWWYFRGKLPLFKAFALPEQEIHLLKENSHDKATLEKVNTILEGEKVDFLFIDGDHTYEGVKKDFEIYAPLVKAGGIIAFHDIVVHPPETGCEVNKFWNELKLKHEPMEIVEDWNQGWGGLGLIRNIKT